MVLGDLSLETSTDPDDAWTMGPPSPCNIEFENANVIIEGKSNLRKQLNRSKVSWMKFFLFTWCRRKVIFWWVILAPQLLDKGINRISD